MSFPGMSRARIEQCVGCGLHFDPEWLVDGLCEECRYQMFVWDQLAERG